MQESRVAIIEDRQVAIQELETRFALAVRQRELLENYIKERLTPGKHFYHIAREDTQTETKPTVNKEGAELICLAHGLKPRYEILSGTENPPLDDTPYQITVRCELVAGEKFGGEGIGSASSMITKKTGERVQRQRDPGLRHNATTKMACKSAYIAATLFATAASEFFTQDLDDDQTKDTAKPDTKGHYCQAHKVNFFKKGKMKGYAHPIAGTDEWCNEDAQPATKIPEGMFTPGGTEPESPSQDAVAAPTRPTESLGKGITPTEEKEGVEKQPETFRNWGDVAARAKNRGVPTSEVFKRANVNSWSGFATYEEAWAVVEELAREKEAK